MKPTDGHTCRIIARVYTRDEMAWRKPTNWFSSGNTNQLAVDWLPVVVKAVNKDIFGRQNKWRKGYESFVFLKSQGKYKSYGEILLHIKYYGTHFTHH